MSRDIDRMTEKEIDDEMRRFHDVQGRGEMTPTMARRLESLRAGARSIRGSKKALYFL